MMSTNHAFLYTLAEEVKEMGIVQPANTLFWLLWPYHIKESSSLTLTRGELETFTYSILLHVCTWRILLDKHICIIDPLVL